MNQKQWQNIFHAIINVNLMVENVIQIKSQIKNCFDLRAKPNKTWKLFDNYLKSIAYYIVII